MSSTNNSVLHENIAIGNVQGVKKCVKDGTNIYARTNRMEAPLYIALLHGHREIANILWDIYASDLKFIEGVFTTDIRSTFWVDTPILIAYGSENIKEFDALYQKYDRCENGAYINMGKYVMFLLKRDNFTCDQVLMLSPTTREGKMLLVSMIKCVNSNGTLDLNVETPDANSLLRASIQSGLFTMFDVLLNYGAEVTDILEFTCYAIEFNRIEFLDEMYKRFKFRCYDWLNSKEFYWPIFKGDNWNAFKYVMDKICVENGLSWGAVLNLPVPFVIVKCCPLTVFEYVIYERQYKIAENCLKYFASSSKQFGPILDLLYLCTESENLVLDMIELDPTLLEYSSSTKVFFHDLVCVLSIATVTQIYTKYAVAAKIFFKHKAAGQDAIDRLLANDQVDKVKCVVENSLPHMDGDTLYTIAYKIVGTNCANLFSYVISANNFDMAGIDLARLLTIAVQHVNFDVFNIVMTSHPDYDLQGIQSSDNNFNLLQILLHQTRDDHDHLISRFFDELIKRGVNYNTVTSDGKSMLHHAVEFNNYEATKKLLQLGLDIDRSDSFGKMPVHYARSVKIYQLLNTWTTTPYDNVCTIYEWDTILHLAVSSRDDRIDLIRFILDNGGNVNAINNDGKSPIYYVHDVATAKLISQYKPNLKIVDKKGRSPLINFLGEIVHNHAIINVFYEPAAVNKNSDVRKYLIGRCSEHDENTTFFIEMIRNCEICTNTMLEFQCKDMLAKTGSGLTPLHIAAELKNYKLIDKLIKHGLSLDTRNQEGETPFLFYLKSGMVAADDGYKRLLKYNPKVNRKRNDGATPLAFAVKQLNVYTYDLICELLLRGANLMDVFEFDRTVYLVEMAYEAQQIFRFAL